MKCTLSKIVGQESVRKMWQVSHTNVKTVCFLVALGKWEPMLENVQVFQHLHVKPGKEL